MYIIPFYGRGNGEVKSCSRPQGWKGKLWLGTQVRMTPKPIVFSSSHSAFQAFLNYRFWPTRVWWRLSLRSVVSVKLKKKNAIYCLDWGWSKGGQAHLSSVPTDSLLEKSRSLPLMRNEPKSVRAEGTGHTSVTASSLYRWVLWSR